MQKIVIDSDYITPVSVLRAGEYFSQEFFPESWQYMRAHQKNENQISIRSPVTI